MVFTRFQRQEVANYQPRVSVGDGPPWFWLAVAIIVGVTLVVGGGP